MELRKDGRRPDELRPIRLARGVNKWAEGSCLIELGDTRVICTASVEDKVPGFLKGQGTGWVTAEYSMLPRACDKRNVRDASTGRPSGRSSEIQRLIGRSLRAVVDLNALGERTITLDCDVLLGDGGTRGASITGAYVALVEALHWLRGQKVLQRLPLLDSVAALSVGVVGGVNFLDLTYEEDSRAAVDMNVVMTGKGQFVEVQGTAETAPFDKARLDLLLEMAKRGMVRLFEEQRKALADVLGIKG